MRGVYSVRAPMISEDGRLSVELDCHDMPAVLKIRCIPPSRLAAFDIRSELGLDHLLYFLTLINEDEG